MMIDVLEITKKQKQNPVFPASPDDFRYDFAGNADPAVVITDATVSLYCLERETRRALFVQVRAGVDITAAPFMYMAQYDHAERLFAVPYDTLHRLAADIHTSGRLIFIYSTGRAGSTLLSKAFAEIDEVTSLAEPDIYTQAVALRLAGEPDDEVRDLLTSSTKILFNPTFTRGSALHVVKPRSQAIENADLISAGFPTVRNIFLYRDLAPYMRSATRAFGIAELPPDAIPVVAASLARMNPLLAEALRDRPAMSGFEIPGYVWLSAVHAYARLGAAGIAMLLVRYEDLVTSPTRVLEMILSYLDLPHSGIDSALQAFERDSQAGSSLSREEAFRRSAEITDGQWTMIRELLQRYPIPAETLLTDSLLLPDPQVS